MKQLYKLIILVLFPFCLKAQTSLNELINSYYDAKDAGARYISGTAIYRYYEERNRDSALFYAKECMKVAADSGMKISEAQASSRVAYQLVGLGRFGEALERLQHSFAILENKNLDNVKEWEFGITQFKGNKRLLALSYTHHVFAILMMQTNNHERQVFHFKEGARIATEIKYPIRVMLGYMNLGQTYLSANKIDSALYYAKQAESLTLQSDFKRFLSIVELILGDIYLSLTNDSAALNYYYKGLQSAIIHDNVSALSRICLRLTKHHLSTNRKDSAIFYALKNVAAIRSLGSVIGDETNMGLGYDYLSRAYEINEQFDSAFHYQRMAMQVKDSLSAVKIRNLTAFQNLGFNEQLRLQQRDKENVVYQNKLRTYFFLAGIGVLLLLAIVFYKSNRQKHKANLALQKAYQDLKTTQEQLIQSEKMASLGVLTAGIAHEIQNPLNFINNFSELNVELLDEMQKAAKTGNGSDAIEIAANIRQNLDKVCYHGKRADAIVKSMLQHSRKSMGTKEPVNINQLVNEYLRLSYQGFKTKEKSLNVIIETHLDPSVGELLVVGQDIGRVLLNLFNNAFYSVNVKKKHAGDSYEPMVQVTTRRINQKVEIRVKDNGTGIPEKLIDKIYQPFFTTKPTGEGTGLGLSLSYDIICKVHGGDLKVDNKDGEGAVFIIELKAD